MYPESYNLYNKWVACMKFDTRPFLLHLLIKSLGLKIRLVGKVKRNSEQELTVVFNESGKVLTSIIYVVR